jgi:hypothetical protein
LSGYSQLAIWCEVPHCVEDHNAASRCIALDRLVMEMGCCLLDIYPYPFFFILKYLLCHKWRKVPNFLHYYVWHKPSSKWHTVFVQIPTFVCFFLFFWGGVFWFFFVFFFINFETGKFPAHERNNFIFHVIYISAILSRFINADIEYCWPSVSYSTSILQCCRQMSKNVSYIPQTIFIWNGIRLQVNVVPQCRNTLQYVVSYVKFLGDFAQTKYCSSNEKNNNNTNVCIVWYAGSYLQVWRQPDENWHNSGPQMFRHTIFDKRGAILWWLFEELLKVFTWLVGFSYQLSIISALIRKHSANFRWKQAENLPRVVQ